MAATVTIGKNAGNSNFHVPKLVLEDFLATNTLKHTLTLGAENELDTLSFAEKESEDVFTFKGQFDVKGLRKDDIVKAVESINEITLTQKAELIYTIAGLALTGADLATADAFNAYVNSLEFKLVGNGKDNDLTGGKNKDELLGGDGNDSLDGGADDDKLVGGDGDDFYFIDNGDKVSEDKGGKSGFDTIVYDGSVNLGKFDNVEAAVLDGKSNADATGNDDDNTLKGNEGNNTLDGGKGADKMFGGDGNDTYIVDNGKDTVIENGKASDSDTVKSSVTFDLSKIESVEDLVLTGKDDIDAFGNDGKNNLTGNDGNNILNGGKGADVMVGGDGNDTYFVDDKDDSVVEKGAKSDKDTIKSSISVDISKLGLIENIFLLGKANINAEGNSGDNVIGGNTGKNKLTGDGGADKFEFFAGGGSDTITDFNAKNGAEHDLINLSDFGNKPLKFGNLDIDKIGKTAIEINFGKGDSLRLDLVGSTTKDFDASDFIF